MRQVLVPLAIALMAGAAAAKLPPPDDAAKAKAAEAAAKAAWQAKVAGYELCKAQDRVAAVYRKTAASKGAAQPAAAAPTKPAQPAAPAAAAPASAPAAAASGTPVASAPLPPCVDPGPFASNPPQQKPLETSGAHSPSGTAATPPSVRAESGTMQAPKKP